MIRSLFLLMIPVALFVGLLVFVWISGEQLGLNESFRGSLERNACWEVRFDPRGEGNAETWFSDDVTFSDSFVTLNGYWEKKPHRRYKYIFETKVLAVTNDLELNGKQSSCGVGYP